VRVPRRLNEESEFFAKLVADMRRDRPSPEPLQKLLEAISAMPDIEPETAKFGGKKWILLAGAGLLTSVGVAVFTAQSFSAGAPFAPSVTADTPAAAVVVAAPSPAREVPSATVDDLPDVPSPVASFGARTEKARRLRRHYDTNSSSSSRRAGR